MGFRATAAAFAASAVMLVAAGCGDDDEGGSGSASTGSSTSASKSAAPEGPPIKVGFVCSCSGGQADALGRSKDVAEAWAKTVNESGGINGHPVKLFGEDDGGDPAKALKAVKKLVEQDKVVAIVGTTSSPTESWAKYVESKGVPVVGGNTFLPPFAASANFFPVGPPLPVMLFGVAKIAKDAGKTTLGAVYCAETPICAQLGGLAEAIGKLNGLKVKTGKAGVSQPNFTALCLSLKNDGVDALAVAQSSPTVRRVHKSCAQQGYEPLPINYTSGISPAFYKDANLNGKMQLVGAEANYQDQSVPEVKRFSAALDKHVAGLRDSDAFSYSGTWDTWVSGALFEKAATAAKLTPTSTPEDLKTGLYSLKEETLEGAVVPLTFTKDKPTLVTCYFPQAIEGGKLASKGTEPTCLSPEELAGLGKILGG